MIHQAGCGGQAPGGAGGQEAARGRAPEDAGGAEAEGGGTAGDGQVR